MFNSFMTPWTVAHQAPLSWDFQARILVWAVTVFSRGRGIFLTQGLNPHLLHWEVDSLPLSHQESPIQIQIFDKGKQKE